MIKQLLSFFATTALFILPSIVCSQTYQPSNRTPVADNTLNTQVAGNGNNFNITGGLSKGQTLFHSFNDFSIPTNGAANFTNPAGNRDIITRVTGNLFSDLNGTLNSNGANFFLINPNGITFGANAQLNVGKAFMASTANGINLVDAGGRAISFGTNPNGDAPLLSINPNVLFNVASLTMAGGNGQINNFGTLQNLNPNPYFGFIGGNVSFNGGKIAAPGGRVEIGGLSAPGTVTLGVEGNNFRAQFPNNVTRGDVSLTAGAAVNASGAGGGDITINARNVNILGASKILSAIISGFGTSETVAGDIKIYATNTIAIADASDIQNIVAPGAVGKGGKIEITTDNLSITDSAQLQASTRGQGDAGTIKITATNNVSLDGRKDGFNSAVFSTVEQGAVGKGGGIEITTGNISVTNGAQLQASTKGQGDAGTVKITATNNVSLDGGQDGFISGVLSTVEQGAVGKGGGIEIATGNLSVTNSAQLQALTRGQGDAGSIKIIAANNISFDGVKDGFGSAALSTVDERGAVGKGGGIEITTRNLSVTNGAALAASTKGKGDAGTVKITATNNISFDGGKDGFNSGAFSTVEEGGAIGKGGGIEITSGNLSLTNGAQLQTSAFGQGNAGNIVLKSDRIILNRGLIASKSFTSTGGDLNIVTKDYLLLRNGSQINTESASTGADGNGGNITISSPFIIALPGNNDITANAVRGNGGRINITSQGLFGIQYRPIGSEFTNDITASSTFGQSGTVNIDTPGADPGKDSTELPNATTDASKQISQVCSSQNRQNKLAVTGRGGLPPTAFDLLNSDVVWQDARAAKSQPAISSATTNTANLPPPAVGWKFDGKGKVTLIAARTQDRSLGTSVTCPK